MWVAICRYPLSLPTRGYSHTKESEKYALKAMAARPEDLKIIAYEKSLPAEIPKGWHLKNSMPYAIFYNNYASFEEYLNCLTKYYRKSIKKSLSKLEELTIMEEQGNNFTKEHYLLYQAVADKSRYQGFYMSMDFFTKISLKHEYISFYRKNKIVGWVLLLPTGQRIYAPICGFDLKINKHYDIWRNLHVQTIKKAIINKYKTVDFGDTAEEGKIRLGCTLEPRYLLIKHENKLFNALLTCTPWFEYKPLSPMGRSCFKEDVNKATG